MNPCDSLNKSKDDYKDLIERISMPDSPVGIDAKYTHAVIIDLLQHIIQRLDALEARLKAQDGK